MTCDDVHPPDRALPLVERIKRDRFRDRFDSSHGVRGRLAFRHARTARVAPGGKVRPSPLSLAPSLIARRLRLLVRLNRKALLYLCKGPLPDVPASVVVGVVAANMGRREPRYLVAPHPAAEVAVFVRPQDQMPGLRAPTWNAAFALLHPPR